jgi:hypothetical protein
VNTASSALTWFAVVSIGLAVVAGGLLGVHTARQASGPTVAELVIIDPELFAGPPTGALTSPGGFSGFGATSLRGEVLSSGELVSVDAQHGNGTMVIRSGSRQLTVHFHSTLRLFQLIRLGELNVGDTVVIRSVDGVATSLLRVPVDYEGGVIP